MRHRELKVWKKGKSYYSGYLNKPLTWDTNSWTNMVSELKSFKEISNGFDYNKTLNSTFIDHYNKP